MTDTHSDAFVFFGATGDLAYKKVFPVLQALIRVGYRIHAESFKGHEHLQSLLHEAQGIVDCTLAAM